MTHLMLLVGAWAGSAGMDGGPHTLALVLTLLCMLGLWLLAEESQRQLRAQNDARVVPFREPSHNARRS